jgi:hypothetical protein
VSISIFNTITCMLILSFLSFYEMLKTFIIKIYYLATIAIFYLRS